MKLKTLLSFSLLSVSALGFAQNGAKTFAITGDGNGDYMWMNIRQVDLSSGSVVKNIYDRTATPFQLFDATSKKAIEFTAEMNRNSWMAPQFPTATMVAAAAYDQRSNKLFFTPMRIGELRWLDLGAKGADPKFYTLQNELLNPLDLTNDANHITRMVIAADGNGYAITNDGNHLFKFTTGRKTVITDLGNLVDASANGAVSIHNKCSSWGGDVIADAKGGLVIISASHHVFNVDLETRIATHAGYISGLPAGFTTNGAAVDNGGALIVSSANSFHGFYKVNLTSLTASLIENKEKIYNASDLANSNLLNVNNSRAAFGAAELRSNVVGSNAISVYPNPITTSTFRVTFDNNAAGNYNIGLTDLQGRVIYSKQVFVAAPNQVETIKLKVKPASGMYMVRVVDGNQKAVFTDKVVID